MKEGILKKWHLPLLVILVVGTVYAIRNNQREMTTPFQQEEGVIFGTVYHTKYQSEVSLAEEIRQELGRVDASLSMFNPHSTISCINNNEAVECDSLLNDVFSVACKISKETDGAFDVTVAPLVNAWGFGFKHGQMPDAHMVDSLMQHVGWRKVTIKDGRFQKDSPEMVMDFSAIAKGYGVDRVAQLFRRKGIKNFMIEIGGEIVTEGVNQKRQLWNIGINKPDDDSTSTNNDLQEVLKVSRCCMATSGNYRNFYIKDGKKIAHTIDPHTGYPVQHTILSSTVLAPSCAMADAYATSFMVMGLDKAKAFVQRHKELKAYFIFADENGNYQVWTNIKLNN